MRYTPFDAELHELTETHLAGLRHVAEGWYVEYKSEVPKPRDLAKSLSSFANRYGGWLFLGIQEESTNNTAASFPGIPDPDVPAALEQIRNAAKDLLQPTAFYNTHTLAGPLPAISLAQGRSIIVVRIPEGGSPPYVHNNGRVYIRTGDSSSPVPATDRATFELLHRKGEEKASLIEELVDRRPTVSKGEEDTSYLHLVLSSDPFQVLGHFYSGSFSAFSKVMQGEPLPFDNFYTSQNGLVARQALRNKRYNRIFTWEFSRTCNSFVTLPIPALRVPNAHSGISPPNFDDWSEYTYGKTFAISLDDRNLEACRVLNLNILLHVLAGVIARHRTLAGYAGVKGPFYIKAMIDNIWRTVPFIDTEEYISHIGAFDVPVVQDSDLTAPSGRWPEGFITAPELDQVPNEDLSALDATAFTVWIAIMQALGIPGEVLAKNPGNVFAAANREAQLHRNRPTS